MIGFHGARAIGPSLVTLLMTTPSLAAAQGPFHLRPFVNVAEVYESNLFSAPTGRQEDFITRLTPGLESDYRSPLWTFSGRYALDIERFADHAELNATDARQQATLAVGYRPAPRLSVAGRAEYLATRTPGELNVATGLSFTRARAERLFASSLVTRQLSPVTTGTLDYAFTADRLSGGFAAHTHAAQAAIERRVSTRTAVAGHYRVEHFAFTGASAPRLAVSSHAVGIGVRRSITRDLRVSIEAGPRLVEDRIRPEMTTALAFNGDHLDLSLAYGRRQGTAIGLIGPVDTHSVQATAVRRFGRWLEVRVVPGAFRSTLAGLQADVYVLALGMQRRFSNGFAVDVAMDGAVQRGTLFAGSGGGAIPRHSVVVRLVAAPPETER